MFRCSLARFLFYQVNTLAAEQLYGIAAQYAQLTPDDLLLDPLLRHGHHWSFPWQRTAVS